MSTATLPATLAHALWPAEGRRALARDLVLVVLGTLLLTASAKVQVPFWPVPMTMQTFVVLLIGAAYGWRLGALTVLFYLAQGAIGLPVFAGTPERGIGLAYLLGPTGGYLLGFALAAAVVGALTTWQRSIARTVAAMALGELAIFACGLLWLSTLIGVAPAVSAGLLPFIPGELLKIALAVAVLRGGWVLLERRA